MIDAANEQGVSIPQKGSFFFRIQNFGCVNLCKSVSREKFQWENNND
ncbi:hypothetical protein D1BOALGB6SA_7838 [Olavius sp. associated proteobacterium Delta 1]|nr:hypothetical protein D1BOALGB6SA_7838 [Olavius sp. associated proteobacterium Delta 1]